MMGRTFRRSGDGVRAQFDRIEVELLRTTREELRASLERHDPFDPVVRRMFPPMVLGDEQAEAETRDLLHDELVAERLRGLDALVELLDRGEAHRGGLRVELTDEEPFLVLGVLNDLRLAIGASVDVEALDRSRVDEDDVLAYRLAVMDHFAWMQEQLLAILDPPSVRHDEAGPDDAEFDPFDEDEPGPDD